MSKPATLFARNVGFSYPRSHPIISDWNASFEAGSVTAITGPSGCGKSTRLYMLGLMASPTAGQIDVDQLRVDDLPDAARARIRAQRFGFVFQDALLDTTRSVLDNILEPLVYNRRSSGSSEAAALDLIDRFDIAVLPRRRPGQISGGQAQRIALCRALIGKPQFLFADEPTGNLDPISSSVVLDAFRDAARDGTCVVLVTHDPLVASGADIHLKI